MVWGKQVLSTGREKVGLGWKFELCGEQPCYDARPPGVGAVAACGTSLDAPNIRSVQAGHVHAHEGAALWGREGREGGGVLSRYVPSHGRHPDSAHGMPQHAQHAS